MNTAGALAERMQGIVAVVNTPFTERNEIDHVSLRRYVDYALSGNAVGFLVPAMAAEVDKLSFAERYQMVQTVLERVAGQVPVIGGASYGDRKQRLRMAEKLLDLGCDAILVQIPFRGRKRFMDEVREISALNPPLLVLQDWDAHGPGIPVEVIRSLFEEIPSFRLLKVEVIPAGVKYTSVLGATDGRLHVAGGWAAGQMIEALDRGVHTFMPTILHGVYDRIFHLHRNGRREEAISLFQRVLPVLAFNHQHPDIAIHFNKRWMFRPGIFSTPRVRPPILPFDEYYRRLADELIDYGRQIEDSLPEE